MADVAVEIVERLRPSDLNDLCDAAHAAIADGGGFGWLVPPSREVLERYWKGVLVVPERMLFVIRLDGVIAGSAQLVRPPRNNEAQAHSATLTTAFVAPWARGHGLARTLTLAVEAAARETGVRVLNLDVRETQSAAVALYGSLGYRRIGRHPLYAMVDGVPVAGLYFFKDLSEATER
jgi:ribosomal protein S18 acetylase RimI-like enzyme